MTRPQASRALCHPLLTRAGVEHGFGTRGSGPSEPALVARPKQVHGASVATADAAGGVHPEIADAVVSREAGVAAAILTADCVPILACTEDGRSVVAIHAGWRGLAGGVIGAGLAALRAPHGNASPLREPALAPAALLAVVGPHIGPCCYEVDAPVVDQLRARFPDQLSGAFTEPRADSYDTAHDSAHDGAHCATRASRPGHVLLDLAVLVQVELARAGVMSPNRAVIRDCCTRCDPLRFHSYRRDGESAGRMLHYVVPRPSTA